MGFINLLLVICVSVVFFYACWKRPGSWRHIIATYWAGSNLAVIQLGMRNIDSISDDIVMLTGLVTVGALSILAIPIIRHFRTIKKRVAPNDWNPGVPPPVIYLCVAVTAPIALVISYLSHKPILLSNVPPPYSYVVLGAFGLLAVISLMAIFGLLPKKMEKR